MHLPPSNHAFLPFFGLHKQSTGSTSSRSRPETPTMSVGTSVIDEQVECAAEHATKNVDSPGVHESTNNGISNPSESMLSRFELLPAELLLSVKGFLGNTDAIHLGMCSQTLRKKVRQSPSTKELNKVDQLSPFPLSLSPLPWFPTNLKTRSLGSYFHPYSKQTRNGDHLARRLPPRNRNPAAHVSRLTRLHPITARITLIGGG